MGLIFLLMHLKMSSAICFNLDQLKILSSGNGFTYYNIIIKLQYLENIPVDVERMSYERMHT